MTSRTDGRAPVAAALALLAGIVAPRAEALPPAPRAAGGAASGLVGLLSAAAFPGADPTGRQASDEGFAAFLGACLSGGHDCLIPPGQYRFERDLVVDFSANRDGGLVLHGSGQNASLLRFAPGRGLKILNGAGGGVFYASFSSFGVLADNPDGPALQLGRDDFADALNGFAFRDLFVKNIASGPRSRGLVLNEVYSSVFSNVTANAGCRDDDGGCPDGGISLQLRQAAFNSFTGSYSGARVGIALTDGYNFGNVFQAVDVEVNFIDLVVANPESRFNSFVGGQWHWFQGPGRAHAVEAAAGLSNVLDNVNFSGPDPIGRAEGLTVRGRYTLVRPPGFPASGAVTQNSTGRTIMLTLSGLRGPWTVCFQQGARTCTMARGDEVVTLPFRTGDAVKIDYAGPPGQWAWTEMD